MKTMDALDLHVFDIVALGDIPVRVAVVGAGTVALDFIGQPQTTPFFVKVDDPRLRDIEITEKILLLNGFHDISDHTLKGGNTFRYRNEDQTITVKPHAYFREEYWDDRQYVNHETIHVSSLRDLQHALSTCHVTDSNGQRMILNYQ